MDYLEWPNERIGDDRFHSWFHPGSNICLDFHGDPVNAQLVVLSDGNHHMALGDCLTLFSIQNNSLSGIFYATTPPGPIANILRAGGLQMGNLTISVCSHVFISPPKVLDGLVRDGLLSRHAPFVRNQGNVLLVKKGNPKKILQISDLARKDVRLFLSNPDTEKVSFSAYYDTLKALSSNQAGFPDEKINKGQVVFGKLIHHREAPQAVAGDLADAAMVFYHLALRYIRIFPDLFEMVPLGGSIETPRPRPGNIISSTHLALVGDGGEWGKKFAAFLKTDQAADIYLHHGLLPLDQPETPWG